MGSSQSTQVQRHQELLGALTGADSIPYQDNFWAELFSCFTEPLISLEPKAAEEKLKPYSQQLLIHNPMTHNYQNLVIHTVTLLSDAATDVRARRAATNAIRLCSSVVKAAAETGNGSSLLTSLFEITSNVPIPPQLIESGSNQLLRLLVRRCLMTLINQQPRGIGYLLMMEVIHLLLLLLASTQLNTTNHMRGPPGTHPGAEALCSMTPMATQVVSVLLALCIQRPLPPEEVLDLSQPSGGGGAPQGGGQGTTLGAVATAACNVWTAVMSGGADQEPISDFNNPAGALTPGYPLSPSPLGDLAVMLLLVLTHTPDQPPAFNPYRLAVRDLGHSSTPVVTDLDRSSSQGRTTTTNIARQSSTNTQVKDMEGGVSSSPISTRPSNAPTQPSTTTTHDHDHQQQQHPPILQPVSFSDLHDAIARALTAPAVMSPPQPGTTSGSSKTAIGNSTSTNIGIGIGIGIGVHPSHEPSSSAALLSRPMAWHLGAPRISSGSEEALNLLYLLLTTNSNFQVFLVNHPDPLRLTLPLMRLLYMAQPKQQAQLMYLVQILVLILSQDSMWCSRIHKLTITHGLGWCKEVSKGVTLGSLVVVVLCKAISGSWSLSVSSDLVTPSNALAALANLSPYCTQLHARAAQRLLALLGALTKKYMRMGGQMGGPIGGPLPLSALLSGDASDAGGGGGGQQPTFTTAAGLSVVEDYLRIILEIINSSLTGPTNSNSGGGGMQAGLEEVARTGQLASNVELLYALLHLQDTIMLLRDHSRLGLLATNLWSVIDFFNQQLEQYRNTDDISYLGNTDTLPVTEPGPSTIKTGQSWSSTSQVLKVLTISVMHWRHSRLRPFPQLQFRYTEEEPEAYFGPYIWGLILTRCGSVLWEDALALALDVSQSTGPG